VQQTQQQTHQPKPVSYPAVVIYARKVVAYVVAQHDKIIDL